jgi:hypothetical protein
MEDCYNTHTQVTRALALLYQLLPHLVPTRYLGCGIVFPASTPRRSSSIFKRAKGRLYSTYTAHHILEYFCLIDTILRFLRNSIQRRNADSEPTHPAILMSRTILSVIRDHNNIQARLKSRSKNSVHCCTALICPITVSVIQNKPC